MPGDIQHGDIKAQRFDDIAFAQWRVGPGDAFGGRALNRCPGGAAQGIDAARVVGMVVRD